MKSVYKGAAMILGMSLFFTACGGPSSPTLSTDGERLNQEERPLATTLVVAIGKDPQELDPATSYNTTQDYVVSTLFDGLTRYKPGTLEIEPGLAESWDISSDGLTYTFHLRKGVQFHDGAPLNAGAVVQWMDRLLNPESPYYHKKRRNAHSSVAFDAFFHVVSYEAVDDDTFVLKLEEPVPSLLQELAHPRAGITSPAADERYGLDIGRHPVGTGPYRLVEWEPEQYIRLAANPNYWGGAPAIPELVFRVVPDSSAGLGLLRDGEVHILADVNGADVDTLKDDPQIRMLSVPGPFQLFISLPVERPPFSDRRVRQALNHAVDKDDLNRRLYRGLAQPMTAPLPSVVWGHSASLQPYDYDLEKARRLLAEAGYPDGFEATLYVIHENDEWPPSYNPVGDRALGEAIKGYLANVGVTVHLEPVSWVKFHEREWNESFQDMAPRGRSSSTGDPYLFLAVQWSTSMMAVSNLSHYSNPEVDGLLEKVAKAPTLGKAWGDYQKLQEIIWQDAPAIWLSEVFLLRPIRSCVEGMELSPTGMFFDMHRVTMACR